MVQEPAANSIRFLIVSLDRGAGESHCNGGRRGIGSYLARVDSLTREGIVVGTHLVAGWCVWATSVVLWWTVDLAMAKVQAAVVRINFSKLGSVCGQNYLSKA